MSECVGGIECACGGVSRSVLLAVWLAGLYGAGHIWGGRRADHNIIVQWKGEVGGDPKEWFVEVASIAFAQRKLRFEARELANVRLWAFGNVEMCIA